MEVLDAGVSSWTLGKTVTGIRDNRSRAKVACILLYIIIACDVLLLLSDSMNIILLNKVIASDVVSREESRMNILQQQITTLLYDGVLIGCVVTFIRWFRRAYYNVHRLDGAYPSYTEGWAAGAWFVPIFHWIGPYRIMKEICEETTHFASKVSGREFQVNLLLVGWWWGLRIVEELIPIGMYVIPIRYGPHGLILRALIGCVGVLVDIITAIMLITVIKKVASAEEVLYQQQESIELLHP